VTSSPATCSWTAYELLSGRRPFAGLDDASSVARNAEMPPAPLAEEIGVAVALLALGTAVGWLLR
jgi:hypothetical protein